MEDLARKAAMSPRTFARRLQEQTSTTPHRWLMHHRLLSAQRCLEKSCETIDQVAEVVGMQTATILRPHSSQVLGTTPTAYQRQFSTIGEEACISG